MKKISLLFLLSFSFLFAYTQAPVDFYLTASYGSHSNLGGVVKTDGQGNNHQITPFRKYKERSSMNASPIEPVSGLLYGMTSLGGDYDHGVIWEYDIITNAYEIRHSFDSINGKFPNGSLVLASNGKLYGMTKNGGANDKGVLFQYDLSTHDVLKLFDFGSTNGEEPKGSLIQGTDGKLYGMTSLGGSNGQGVIFNYDLSSGIFSKLMDFDGATNGSTPYGDLFQASNGIMYAFTRTGGASNYGVMFSFDPVTSTYTKIMDLVYATAVPEGSFIQSTTDGKLYGLARTRLIKYDISTGTSELITSSSPLRGTPVQKGSEILFYSEAVTGNMYQTGSIAKYTTFIQVMAYFASGIGQPNDGCGSYLSNGLLLASNNRLYGITRMDSDYHGGALFSYQGYGTQFRPEVKFNIQSQVGSSTSDLVQVDRKLYGIGSGGKYNDGTIYRYDIDTDSLEVMVDFNIWTSYVNTGMNSFDKSFVLHPNGKLYSVYYGLNGSAGFMMEYVPGESTYTSVYDFGANPNTMTSTDVELMVGADGLIYGVSNFGGANTYGNLFSFDVTTGTYTLLHSFEDLDGFPNKRAVKQASNGKLYGITPGEVNGTPGYIYSFDLTNNTFEEIYQLGSLSYPMGSFVEGPNGILYASFRYGGTNGDGAIISLDPTTNNVQTVFSFEDAVSGSDPLKIFMGTNGKIYGFTTNYALDFFEIDPVTGQHESVHNYYPNNELGTNNYYGYTSVCHDIFVTSTLDSAEICPLTTFNYTATATGDSLAYQWMKDSTLLAGQTAMALSIASVSSSDAGMYYCVVSNGCREVISDSLVLTVLPQPTIDAGLDQHICNDSLTTLTASGTSISYSWTGGITDGNTFTVTENATYVVTGTDAFGCTNTDTVAIAITPVVYAGPDTTVCYMTPATFFGSGDAVSYVWNDSIADGEPLIIDSTQQVIVKGFNAAGCFYTDTLTVFMDTCQLVWPGDTDNDAGVDIDDFFNIGLNYGQTGAARNTISTLWEAQPAPIWDSTMSAGTGAGLNMAYADCNGDGTVDAGDTLAVHENLGLIHAGKPIQPDPQNLDQEASIYFSSTATEFGANQLVTIDILAGTATQTLDIYGLGFKVNYTATGIVPGSLQIHMNDATWIGTVNDNAIRLGVASQNTDHFSLALCRTDHSNVSGFGVIGQVSFLTSTLPGNVDLTISNAVSIDSDGMPEDLISENYSVTIDPALSLSDLTGDLNLVIYPNPSKGTFHVSGLQPEFTYTIVLRDMTGKKVQEALTVSNQTSAQFNANPSSGSYLLEISSGNAVYRKQVSVMGN